MAVIVSPMLTDKVFGNRKTGTLNDIFAAEGGVEEEKISTLHAVKNRALD
jgi:hypothetical protein